MVLRPVPPWLAIVGIQWQHNIRTSTQLSNTLVNTVTGTQCFLLWVMTWTPVVWKSCCQLRCNHHDDPPPLFSACAGQGTTTMASHTHRTPQPLAITLVLFRQSTARFCCFLETRRRPVPGAPTRCDRWFQAQGCVRRVRPTSPLMCWTLDQLAIRPRLSTILLTGKTSMCLV